MSSVKPFSRPNPPAHTCKNGGELVERPKTHQTPEQIWCGTWFDCTRCGTTCLIESAELRAQHAVTFEGRLRDFKGITRKKAREKFLSQHPLYREYLEAGVNPWKEEAACVEAIA